jgi:hypothetical protein
VKLMEYIWFPMSLMCDAYRILSFEGTWWLRRYEMELIYAAAQNLSPENRQILSQQLKMWFFVQRRAKGRVVHIHKHFLSEVPRMDLPPDYSLARIKVKSPGGITWVSIGAETGSIFFIMYGKRPGPIFKHPFEILKIEYGGKADQRVAKAIHNSEHGDDNPFPQRPPEE